MAKLITVDLNNISVNDQARIKEALLKRYGSTWGIADSASVTNEHVSGLLESFLYGQIKKGEKDSNSDDFEKTYTNPSLQT